MSKIISVIEGKHANADIFAYADDVTLAQIFKILNSEMVIDQSVKIMPDCHYGSGCVIGYTQTYDINNKLDPDAIGCDIGCGISTVKIQLPKDSNILDRLDLIDFRIRSIIPLGEEINSKTEVDEKLFRKFIKAKLERARSLWPDAINYQGLNKIDKFIESTIKRLNISPAKFWKSLGTLGGGNHFIEVGQLDGEVYITVHTGSRNLGIKVLSYWKKVISDTKRDTKELRDARKLAIDEIKSKYRSNKALIEQEVKKLNQSDRFRIIPTTLLERPEDISGYLEDMFFAQAYAEFNRKTIMEKVVETFPNAKIVKVIETVHNYIDPYDKIIRKGAIAAPKNVKVVIPINMSFGILIAEGLGNINWNYSAPHGAGRKLSRGKAKELIPIEEFKETMEGIYSTSVTESQIDESPQAYKDPTEIMELIEGECVSILKIVKPILSIKA